MNAKPKTLSELYPKKWLTPDDLVKPVKVTITGLDFVEATSKFTNEKEMRGIISFEKATKTWQALPSHMKAIGNALDTETFEEWIGRQIVLSRGKSKNGNATIEVTPVIAVEETSNPFA